MLFATEMSLHVLAYNFKRVMNLLGIAALIRAIKTSKALSRLFRTPTSEFRANDPDRRGLHSPHSAYADVIKDHEGATDADKAVNAELREIAATSGLTTASCARSATQ